MNKIITYSSIALNAVLVTWLISVLIPKDPELVDLSTYTQQDLSKAKDARVGITSDQLTKLMGSPAVKEFDMENEEWHYCKTGYNVDEYMVFELKHGKVTSSRYYTVSWLDVVYYHTQQPTEALIEVGGMGDCKLTVKWGTYPKAASNKNTKPSVF